MIKKTITNMIDNVVKKYGFENKRVVKFCEECEKFWFGKNNWDIIERMYNALMG